MRRTIIAAASSLVVAACTGAGVLSGGTGSTAVATTLTAGTLPAAAAPVTTTATTVGIDAEAGAPMAVSIPAGDLDLAATFTVPTAGGPHPAVLFLHGSGPISRDGTVPGQLNMVFPAPISVYRDLAEAFDESGYATLRYDKRSCGPFNGCADNGYPLPADDITIDVFLDDVRSAIAWLQDRSEVSQVHLVGHSQGATFVPLLLAEDGMLGDAVLLGAPYRTIEMVLAEQAAFSRTYAADLGIPQAQIDAAVAPLEELAGAVAALRDGGDEPVGGVSADFWRSWMGAGESAQEAVAGLSQTLLVVGGGYDWNVGPVEYEAWQQATAGTRHQTTRIDCLTHALNCVDQPDPLAITPDDIGRKVAPEAIEALLGFFGR